MRYMPSPDGFMTVAEVAQTLRVTSMSVYRLIKSGDLPALRVGRSLRIRADAFARYLDDARTEAS